MKTIKVSEATTIQLDWLVAKCEGDDLAALNIQYPQHAQHYPKISPSTDWAQGGPIIDREKIAVSYEPSQLYDDSCRWKALGSMSDNDHQYGPTPLIAAMRCYVASKMGDTVEGPEEL